MRTLSAFVLLLIAQDLQAQKPFRLEIHAGGDIEFVLVDPSGRREGVNPITGERFRGINNSYGVFSIDSEDPDIDAPPSVIEYINSHSIPGTYSFTVFGRERSTFQFSFLVAWEWAQSSTLAFEGVIDSLQSTEFILSIEPSSRMLEVHRGVTASTLRQDLDNCYKLDLIEGEPLYADLSRRVDKYELLSESDTAKARGELEKLEKKLEEVWEKSKGPSRDPNHVLKDLAYRILTEDVRELLK